MPRYFLHIRDGATLLKDPDGSELPDLEAARAEALAAARQLLVELIRADKVLNGQRFEIVDETGTLLAVVPIREALRLN